MFFTSFFNIPIRVFFIRKHKYIVFGQLCVLQQHFKTKNKFNSTDYSKTYSNFNASLVSIFEFKFKFMEPVKIVTKTYEHPLN